MKKAAKKAAKKKAVKRIRRSARSGKFVTDAFANLHPATTVCETAKKAKC